MREALLVHLMEETPMAELLIHLCSGERDRLRYTVTKSRTEMGYVAHLMRLAQLLTKMCEADESLRATLQRRSSGAWNAFEQTVLK